MKQIQEYFIIGLMSGTSLDGLDVAYCRFYQQDGTLKHELVAAENFAYSEEWKKRLSSLTEASACEYALADVELGHLHGRWVCEFMQRHPGHVDAIASHGHTVFHQPQCGLTTQIGDGASIAAETGLPVVYDFRRLDVALGGQGAPLVPIGDKLLFSQYDACLNLGGIANISFDREGRRVAWDICPCNMGLNYLAQLLGLPYDADGQLARQGGLNAPLLDRMNSLAYYRAEGPKSLGKEWFDKAFLPMLQPVVMGGSDFMVRLAALPVIRTLVEHIAYQVSRVVNEHGISTILVTGGGARNRFLEERIRTLCPQCQVTIPEGDVIDYKEAMVFALLGYLRLTGQDNCLGSVTGARCDSCGGSVVNLR